MSETRVCIDCRRELPVTAFHRYSADQTARAKRCASCTGVRRHFATRARPRTRVPYTPLTGSLAAVRWGQKFRAELARRGLTYNDVSRAVGVNQTSIRMFATGKTLPSLTTGAKITEAIGCEALMSALIEIRTSACALEGCGRTFVRDSHSRQVYCSAECAYYADKGVAARKRHSPEAQAIDAFCRACEPEGLCRDDQCPLRAFSPLPVIGQVDVTAAIHREPDYRATAARVRARNLERWSDPANRQRQSEAVRRAWEARRREASA